MSRKFYAIHRETGERWKGSKFPKEYLVMYDSGYLAVVTELGYCGDRITPLDTKVWRVQKKFNKEDNR